MKCKQIIFAPTLTAVALALAHRWKSINELSDISPKEKLLEVGIKVPPDVVDSWDWFDFLSLVEQCLYLEEEVKQTPIPLKNRRAKDE